MEKAVNRPPLPAGVVHRILSLSASAPCDLPFLYCTAALVCRQWLSVTRDPSFAKELLDAVFGSSRRATEVSHDWYATIRDTTRQYFINRTDESRLQWLIIRGHSNGVRGLVRVRGRADQRWVDQSAAEETPLQLATRLDSVACVSALLDSGADVNAFCRLGRTALHTAAYHNRAASAKVLIARGANTRLKETTYGQTAMHIASSRGSLSVMLLLHEAAPDLAVQVDRDGWSPYHVAAAKSQAAALDLLRKWTS